MFLQPDQRIISEKVYTDAEKLEQEGKSIDLQSQRYTP